MLRKKNLLGWVLSAFGLGLVIGQWFTSGMLCSFLGLAFIAVGLYLIGKQC